MKNAAAKFRVLKTRCDMLTKELCAIHGKWRKILKGPPYISHRQHKELLAREVEILDEVEQLLGPAVELVRLDQEISRYRLKITS